MTTRVGADVEAIAIAWLLAYAPITDEVGDRIGTELDLTKASALPAVRLTRISTTVPFRRALDGVNLQYEAWAHDRTKAQDVAELVRGRLLEDAFAQPHPPFGVITGAVDGTGPRPQHDPETGTPRWLGTVIVYARTRTV